MKKSLLTPHEKAELIRLIDKMQTTTQCPDCKRFQNGYCTSAEAIIPADVMDTGCELWEFDPVSAPF